MLLYSLKVIASPGYSATPCSFFEAPDDHAESLIRLGAAVPALPSAEGLILARPLTPAELAACHRTCREHGLPLLDAAQREALQAARNAIATEEAA